jgi:hypothetical protein
MFFASGASLSRSGKLKFKWNIARRCHMWPEDAHIKESKSGAAELIIKFDMVT